MHPTRRQTTAGAFAAMVTSGCSAHPAKPRAAFKLRFATDWRAEAEHGGFYQALAMGQFARRGLDVDIVQGTPGGNVPLLLAGGAAEMGIGTNSFVALNVVQQKIPLTAVAAIMQKDPQVLMAHKGAGISSLTDMKGHPIYIANQQRSAMWLWLKSRFGLSDSQVRTYEFNLSPFLLDRRAVQEGYITSEPYLAEKLSHQQPVVFLLADYGYNGYGTLLMAANRLIEQNPSAVASFVDACADGWRAYLYGDPRPADRLILAANSEMTADILQQARDKLRSYSLISSGAQDPNTIGSMTDQRWEAFFRMASGLGLYSHALNFRIAYTLRFIPAAR
jgi:NitT/TauT family transport system substrate-binding protein